MRRRRFRKPAVSMTLFPFLAVLVCTMGVLIVLLISLVQQARVYAGHVTEQRSEAHPNDPQAEPFEERIDELKWRREVLETQRKKLTEDLANQRLQLSHLEDHIKRLEQQWAELRQQAQTLESMGAARSADAARTSEELQELRNRIEAARERREELEKEIAKRPRRFAIIPYTGPNGTQRRPIYIECTQSGIVLQPEGVVLRAEDFDGPLGPGNPLDAALRAEREYLAKIGDVQRCGEPYPLLVVRPDGAVAYSVARAAMKSWDEEFGYELIEKDMVLQFPPADPQLRSELERTIQDARQRQAALAAAMPSQFLKSGSAEGFVATPTRGGFVTAGSSGGGIGSRGPGSGGFGGGSPGGRPSGATSGSSPAPPSGSAGGGNALPGMPPEEPAMPGEQPGSTDRPSGNQPASSGVCSLRSSKPMAETRGTNWALPKSQAQSTGITRPIYVACHLDQLIIVPEKGDHHAPEVIATPGPLADSMDPFVSALWKHMDQWGLAVAGGYWKPVLQVTVARGAEERFEELRTVLQGSGIEVTRKER